MRSILLARTAPALLATAALLGVAVTTPATAAGRHAVDEQRETVRVGTSVLGRPVLAVHRWRPGATTTVLVIGSMHGDERAGLRVVSALARDGLPRDLDLWLVRTANPDGTEADRRTNARGVDLNRSFPRRWQQAGRGTSTWSGPFPASEPETQALMSLIRQIRPRTTIVVHQPLFGIDSYRAKSMRLVRALSRGSGLPVRSFDCRGGCHGTLTDWVNDRTPGRAVTVELGHRASAGRIDRIAAAVLAATAT